MTLYQKMLVFYAIMGVICAVISWFLTKESRMIRLLAALLIGAT
ncbi:TPA: GhoT/OrtT family toxin [Klebsiella pneumoniae]|nr:GhoT/OrtT family toxin [Klebsiella pneumoniae]HBT8419461.1 GhoT/OrtT family toxin [Klebsiella pneumoniae]